MLPVNPSWIAIWTLVTLAIAWFFGLNAEDKKEDKKTATSQPGRPLSK